MPDEIKAYFLGLAAGIGLMSAVVCIVAALVRFVGPVLP